MQHAYVMYITCDVIKRRALWEAWYCWPNCLPCTPLKKGEKGPGYNTRILTIPHYTRQDWTFLHRNAECLGIMAVKLQSSL